jgi:hypothetical protein
MKDFMKQIIGALALFASMAAQASPTVYNFSYQVSGGNTLYGQLNGELQADNNSVSVLGFQGPVYQSSTAGVVTSNAFAQTFGNVTIDPTTSDTLVTAGPGLVTIDGSTMNWGFCAAICTQLIAFAPMPVGPNWPISDTLVGTFGLTSTGSLRLNFASLFEPSQWSLTPAAAVPLPGSLPLLGLALAGLAFTRRRQA